MRGTYVLFIHVPYNSVLNIGELGKLSLKAGYYAYVGSALSGLKKRVGRHLKREKTLHWHIDYLLTRAQVVDVVQAQSETRKECEIARDLIKYFPCVQDFGSSDCNCRSHLFFDPDFHKLIKQVLVSFKTHGLKPVKGVGVG